MDKTRKLYDALVQDGYELGDFNSFSLNLGDGKKRKSLYDAITNDGYDVGEFSVFENNLGYGVHNDGSFTGKDGDKSRTDVDVRQNIDNVVIDSLLRDNDGTATGGFTQESVIPRENDGNVDGDSFSRDSFDGGFGDTGSMRLAALDGVNKQVANIRERTETEIEDKVRKSNREALDYMKENPVSGTLSFLGLFPKSNPMNKKLADDVEIGALQAAKHRAIEAEETLTEAKKKGNTIFFAGVLRGLWNRGSKLANWDMGSTELDENTRLLMTVKKNDEGVPLTTSEEMLLESAALNQAVQENFSEDLGRGYKAGTVTAESIPFMIEMGLNPASGMGKGLVSKTLDGMIRKYGRETAVKMARSKSGKMMLGTSHVLGDLTGSAIMSATTGSLGVVADAEARVIGHVDYDIDDDGYVRFTGTSEGDNTATALAKAFGARTIENYSEMVGESFGIVGEFAGRTFMRGANRMGLKKVVDLIDNVRASDWAKKVADFERQTHWNGVIGEWGEEQVGTILNSLFIGDSQLSDLVDLDQQIDTALGVGLMGGFLSTVKTFGYNNNRFTTQKKLDVADDRGNVVFGDEWKGIRDKFDLSDLDGKRDLIKRLMDEDLSEDKKRALIDYVNVRMAFIGMNRALRKRLEEGDVTPFQFYFEEIFEQGAVVSPEEMNDLKVELDKAREGLSISDEDLERFGIDSLEDFYGFLDGVNPVQFLSRLVNSDLDSGAVELFVNYYNAKVRYEGMIQGVRDDIDGKIVRALREVDDRTHSDGNIYGYSLKTEENGVVYVIGESRVETDESGSVDLNKSDERVIVRDDSGKVHMLPVRDLNRFMSIDNAVSLKSELEDSIRNEEAEKAANLIDGIRKFELNENVVIQTENGIKDVFVGGFTPDGNIEVYSVDGSPVIGDEVVAVVSQRELSDMEYRGVKGDSELPDITVNDNGRIDGNTVVEAGNLDGSISVDDFTGNLDVSGNPDFYRMPVQETVNVISELGNDEMVRFVEDNLTELSKELDELKSREFHNTDFIQRKNDIEERNARLGDVYGRMDYWNDVRAFLMDNVGDRVPESVSEDTPVDIIHPKKEIISTGDAVAMAESEVDVNPTEKQKEAGNYRKGHVIVEGLEITIEQPKGSVRSGVDENGNEWSVVMNNSYGYIRGTLGKDGEHIDVFLGEELERVPVVFVVDQVNPESRVFDEHKCMIGFYSIEEAERDYLLNYEDGWKGLGNITAVEMPKFKEWLRSSGKKTKPFAEYKAIETRDVKDVDISEKVAFQNVMEEEMVEGDSYYTVSGRYTSAVPVLDYSTSRKAANTITRINSWAIENAIEEANARDDFSMVNRLERLNVNNLSKADLEGINSYLFDENSLIAIPKRVLRAVEKMDTESNHREENNRENVVETEKVIEREDTLVNNDVLPGVREREIEERTVSEVSSIVSEENTPQQLGAEQKDRNAKVEKSAEYGAENKIVSSERYEELRKKLREKLNRLNVGFDPEIFTLGAEMAAYHIEAGARKFADFAARMVADVGDGVRPYLKSFYEAARNFPGMEGVAGEMDAYEKVKVFDVNSFDKLPENEDNLVTSGVAPDAVVKGENVGKRYESADDNVTGITKDVSAENGVVGDDSITSRVFDKDEVGDNSDNRKQKNTDNDNSRFTKRNAVHVSHNGDLDGLSHSEGVMEDVQQRGKQRTSGIPLGRTGKSGQHLSDVSQTGNEQDGSERVVVRPDSTETRERRGTTGTTDSGKTNNLSTVEGNTKKSVRIKRNTRNYNFGREHLELEGGEISKVKANIEAIQVLKDLEKSGKLANAEQKKILSKYVGWGGLAAVLDEAKFNLKDSYRGDRNWTNKYAAHHELLKSLLTAEEFQSAVSSTINSHYTSETVVRGMWNIATRLGFKAGNILEPALGVGNFFGFMPKSIVENSNLSGFELDSISGRISEKLYPDALIRVAGYETAFSPNNKDLIITNVPFGANAPYDSKLDKRFRKELKGAFNLHNYFISKGLLELKEGGLGAFISSASSMDGADSSFREFVVNQGCELVGAIRLPNDAFLKNAGTEVTTDILVFRKLRNGENSNGISFNSLIDIGEGKYREKDKKGNYVEKSKPIMVNEYFADHPEMVLGTMMTAYDAGSGGLYSNSSITCKPFEGKELGKLLEKAIKRFPQNLLEERVPEEIAVIEKTDLRDGTILYRDGKVYTSNNGELKELPLKKSTFKYNGKTASVADAVNDYTGIKDKLRELVRAEQSQIDDPVDLRRELNVAYEDFVRKYGNLNLNKNLDYVLEEDFEHHFPQSLEDIIPINDGKKGSRTKFEVRKGTGILEKRVNYPVNEPTSAKDVEDAMRICISYRGRVDMDYISQMLGKSADVVRDEMLERGVGYIDPITGKLIDKANYLSGNVYEKLAEAQLAAEENPAFERNVQDLLEVQPERVLFGDISYRLGTVWIPEDYVKEFAVETIGLDGDVKLGYNKLIGEWYLDGKGVSGAYLTNDTSKSQLYTTDRVGAAKLLVDALNQRKPKIFDTVKEPGGGEVRILNEAETQASTDKIGQLCDKFLEFIDGRTDWHKRLEMIYNERYNNYRLKSYDLPSFAKVDINGKWVMHYPGANRDIVLREHQMRAVQRSMESCTLLAHQVGTGKTFTMITTGMEMRRLSIARKPMFVVQNATLEDFAKDFMKLYPSANILVPSKNERNSDNRKRLFNLIATGDFDAVIIPQSFLGFIPDNEDRKKQLIQQKIDEYVRVLSTLDPEEDRFLYRRLESMISDKEEELSGRESKKKTKKVKDTARKIDSIKTRMQRKLDRKTDDGITFEEMGVDALFIDEAHNFKKIGFMTKMANVKGIDTSESKRANSLLLKVKWIQERNNGRNVILATGTPVTNTMAEVWTMMNFVAPEILESYHIETFDDFATTFGQVEPSLEFTATGNFKIADRFKSYVNIPELVKAFRSHTDVVLTEDVPEFKESNSIPKLKDGKFTNRVLEKHDDLDDVMQTLIQELEDYSKLTGQAKREKQALPLVVFGKAKQAAIDLRLLNPTFPDNPKSKTNEVVNETLRLYGESMDVNGVQLIFCDSYQSPSEQPKMDLFGFEPNVPQFNLYEDIKGKLIKGGIPEDEIAIVSKYEGDRREKLFASVREGKVRVLLGSTEKMGVGVNVQERLYGLHHMDAPQRPMDFEQRNGRILRQGNLYASWGIPVNVLTYGVEGTLDATAYDRLRIKQNFINQMMKGDVQGRIMEEQDNEDPSGMTFNEMAATLSGDKTAQLLFVAENQLRKLQNLKRSDGNMKSGLVDKIAHAERGIEWDKKKIDTLSGVLSVVEKSFSEGVTMVKVGKETITEKFGTNLNPVIKEYEERYSLNRGTPPLKLILNEDGAQAIVRYNEGRLVYELFLGSDHLVQAKEFKDGIGFMSSVNYQIGNVRDAVNNLKAKIAETEKRISGMKEVLALPFGREDEIREKEKEVEELRKQLEDKAEKKEEKKYREVDSSVNIRTVDSSEVVAEIERLSGELNTPVHLVYDLDEIDKTHRKQVKGWCSADGDVFVVLPNVTDIQDVRETVFHEAVGHKGLHEMYGKDYDSFVDEVFQKAGKNVRESIVSMAKRNGGWDIRLATEEYIAGLAERGFSDNVNKRFWNTVKRGFEGFLRRVKLALGFKLSDNDLRYVLWKSYKKLTGDNPVFLAAEDTVMRNKVFGKQGGNTVHYRKVKAVSDLAKSMYERSVRGGFYKFQEAYQDSMLGLKRLQDAVAFQSGKEIKDHENAYMAENAMSSKNTYEMEFFKDNFFSPMMDAVNVLVGKGKSYEDIVRYLIAKHGLERNEIFAKRDTDRWYMDKVSEIERNYNLELIDLDERGRQLNILELTYDSVYAGFRDKDYSGLKQLTDEETDYEQKARDMVDHFEEGYEKDVESLWERINAATNETLRKSYESGMMSKKTYEGVLEMFENYVPLRGFDDLIAPDVYDYVLSERSPFNPPVKSAKGRSSLADDPLATIGNMAESGIMQGNRNLMKQKFLNLVQNHPTSLVSVKNVWYVRSDTKGEWEISFPVIPENASSEEVAFIVEEHEMRMKELQKDGLAMRGRQGLELNYRASKKEKSEHIVLVRRSGEELALYVNANPRAAQALNGLTNPDGFNHKFMELIVRLNRQLAANFTTRNPAFVLSNLSRDMIYASTAVMVKEDLDYARRYGVNLAKNVKGMVGLMYDYQKGALNVNNRRERYFKEFLENGGETGYTALHNVDEYKKLVSRKLLDAQGKTDIGRIIGLSPGRVTTKNTLGIVPAFRFLAKWIEFGNRCAEDVSRFTVYMTSREMGRSVQRSISDAKEITVNFNKKGAGGYGATTFKSLYLFFNAAVQGLNNFYRLSRKSPVKFGASIFGFTAAGVLLPMMNGLLMELFGSDDDRDKYDNLPEWVRRNNFCLWLGGDRFLTIPLPIELRAFYGTGEIFYQTAAGNMRHRDVMMEFTQQFSDLFPVDMFGSDGDLRASVVPDAAKPIYQIASNRDFFGKPIQKENDFNEDMPEWTKAYHGTSKVLVSSAEFLNEITGGDKYTKGVVDFSPARLEHLFEGYFGGMGKTVNQIGKTISMIWDEDERLMRNVPVMNRFISTTDERSAFTRVNELYFYYLDEYRRTQQRIRGYEREADSGLVKYAEKVDYLNNSPEYLRYEVFKEYQKEIRELQEEIKVADKGEKKGLELMLNLVKVELVEELEGIGD